MKHFSIASLEEFNQALKKHSSSFLLIYKEGAEQSDCALNNLKNLSIKETIPVFSVNVAKVKDVHPAFNITTAPVLIEFKNEKPVRQLKGCHRKEALESFFNPSSANNAADGEKKAQKQVIVYTTPTCSWCKTLKDYLTNNRIQFREIDVTRDEKAATEMVKRSGQQGVPQSLINGQVVVGFDRNKINSLLDIKA